ncbi:hypothetical protein HPB51_002833 [Rhipicephalus microplus]|uniref:Uncharacterized protein n=1 Tax=Rhipicephalus microplus TaxID=6941 RepID=A0A9J6EWN8_RHIMP|nr:hypothetical protein HPB51_002833 [Rhipicephalus microplus]
MHSLFGILVVCAYCGCDPASNGGSSAGSYLQLRRMERKTRTKVPGRASWRSSGPRPNTTSLGGTWPRRSAWLSCDFDAVHDREAGHHHTTTRTDLFLFSFMNEPSNLVHKSPVGILQPRKGAILEKGLGHSVSVCIESSGSHKLQTTSLISVTNTPEGKKHCPISSTVTTCCRAVRNFQESWCLECPSHIPRMCHRSWCSCGSSCCSTPWWPAVSYADVTQSGAASQRPQESTATTPSGSMVTQTALVKEAAPAAPCTSKGPQTPVSLGPKLNRVPRPEIRFSAPHSRSSSASDKAMEIDHKTPVSSTLKDKRSLERTKQDKDKVPVTTIIDLNLSEITSVKCRIYTLNSDISICTDEYASKVMQRCLSIPVTMRAVIRKAQGQRARMSSQGDSYCNALNSSGNTYLTGLPGYGPNPATGSFGDFTPAGKADGYRESEEEPGTLGSLLGGPLPSQSPNMMLMSMLSDVPSASNSPAAPGFPFLGQAKPRNKRKRKATTSSDGRSPKRREDDGGGTDPEEEPFLESEAGQNKAALLNPAEPAGATAELATDDTASFLRGAGGALFPEEGADPGETNRPPGRKVKRVRSEEAREDIKLEREGSRSQDSGPKNLLPGGDSDKLSRSASPPVSFKIEKSGDSLKISKTESKSGSKPRDSSELRKKMDNKKERKRKRAESVDSGCRQPAVAASPEPLELSQQAFNLTTKPHGSVSPSTSRPPLKKSASSLVSNGKKLAKPLQPAPSSGIKSSTETDNRPAMKSPQKSSPSKPVSSVSGSSYVPSSSPVTKQPPSSPTGTLKLKHLNLPSSTTITPVVAKPSLPSPTSTAPPSITIVPTTSVAGGSNNLNKPPKSRKGCLNAVIAKLTNTVASPLVGPPVPELAGSRPDITLKSCEKRDSPTLGKEVKEGRTPSAEGSAVKGRFRYQAHSHQNIWNL